MPPADGLEQHLLQYLKQIAPQSSVQRTVCELVLETTGTAQAHQLFDLIEAALLPVIRQCKGAKMVCSMSRTVPGTDGFPTLSVAFDRDLLEFQVVVIPSLQYVSFAWLYLKEYRFNYRANRPVMTKAWGLGVLHEGRDGYEWRHIPPELRQTMDGSAMLEALSVEKLPPLLPDNIRPYLEYVVWHCVQANLSLVKELSQLGVDQKAPP